MRFWYTSHWKRFAPNTLMLHGILAAGGGNLAAYYPEDADEREEWEDTLRDWRDSPGKHRPLAWLRHITESANGITEEFDEIRAIEAKSLGDAAHLAYIETQERYSGNQIPYFLEEARDETATLFDPLANILPESLLSFPRSRESDEKSLPLPEILPARQKRASNY